MTKTKTYFFDMFSGIGGFALAAYNSGLRFDGHYFSEIDPWAVELYKKRFPDAIALGDITEVNYGTLPKGEWLITGGFPCQPHSQVGKRGGATDKRDLWPECAKALSSIQPRIALFENVSGLFSSNDGYFFNKILSDISKIGYGAEWQIISAKEMGAIHKRERVWIVAHPSSRGLVQNEIQNRIPFQKVQKMHSKEFTNIIDRIFYSKDSTISERDFLRDYYGLSEELDRYKSCGNAIVPACAEKVMSYPAFDFWRVA